MLDDEPRFNLTLLELLRHDFQLNIHGLSSDLPTDGSGIDVEGIWNIVRRAVRDMPGFEVTTDVVLGTFSFSKYLMWRDLIDRKRLAKYIYRPSTGMSMMNRHDHDPSGVCHGFTFRPERAQSPALV